MTQEQIAPIITAAIALLSSLLSFLLAAIFQIIQAERTRKWQKEDLLLQRRLDVIRKRINDAQIFLDNYLDLQNKIINLEVRVVTYEQPNKEMLEVSEQIFLLLDEVNKKLSSILSLGDEELLSIANTMTVLLNSEYEKMEAIIKKRVVNEEINQATEISRINSFKKIGFELIVKVGKRFDELSGLS